MSDEVRLENIERRLEKLEELMLSVASLTADVRAIRETLKTYQPPGASMWCQQHGKAMEAFDKRLSDVERRIWIACGIAGTLSFIIDKILK